MSDDTEATVGADEPAWRGDFRSAEERRLDLSLEASPSERLRWLEEALRFASRVGALPPRGQ